MKTARPSPLAAATLLEIWERGAAWHPLDQALLILQHACPGETSEALSDLTIGQRDTLLLLVRSQTFGDRMDAFVECPACCERLEFTLSCETLLAGAIRQRPRQKTFEWEGAGWELRAPTSRDLAVVALAHQGAEAVEALLALCVTPPAQAAGVSGRWPDALRAKLVAELAEIDPQAEVRLDLTCEMCGHIWQSVFDITGFLWNEVRARSRRLLQETDVLARRYGWSEADILRMSERRRGFYVQMALS